MGRAIAFLAVAFVLNGCGGGGIVAFSLFSGTWAGTWTGGADGTANLSINDNGIISGTMHSNGTGENGTVTGTINNNGNVGMTVTFPGESPESGTGNFTYLGGDTIGGTVAFDAGDVVFELDRQ